MWSELYRKEGRKTSYMASKTSKMPSNTPYLRRQILDFFAADGHLYKVITNVQNVSRI